MKDTSENERVVAIKLKDDGLIIVNVFLCKETYLPKKVEIKCCGSVETWKYLVGKRTRVVRICLRRRVKLLDRRKYAKV